MSEHKNLYPRTIRELTEHGLDPMTVAVDGISEDGYVRVSGHDRQWVSWHRAGISRADAERIMVALRKDQISVVATVTAAIPVISPEQSLTIANVVMDANENSVTKGFWDDLPETLSQRPAYYGNKLMLVVGEVAEAHEELRKNVDPRHRYHREDGKPEGFGSELADIVIRVADLAGALGLNLESLIREKMHYNSTRPHMHGKNF